MSGIVNDVIFPFITTDQMREVDRAMIEDFGISLVQMMENAGRNLAQLARQRFLDGDPRGRRILVLNPRLSHQRGDESALLAELPMPPGGGFQWHEGSDKKRGPGYGA